MTKREMLAALRQAGKMCVAIDRATVRLADSDWAGVGAALADLAAARTAYDAIVIDAALRSRTRRAKR